MGVQQQLSLEDPQSSLKWLPTTIKTKGNTFSSYKEEAPAMESALSWSFTNANHPSITILVHTNNKLLCEALILSNSHTSSIHSSFNSISFSIFIRWIPGHSAILGNKLANRVAKEATTIATHTSFPVSFSRSVQVINETFCNDPPTHKHIALTYQQQKVSHDLKQIKNQKDDVLLACLQSGHHLSLHQYLHCLDIQSA